MDITLALGVVLLFSLVGFAVTFGYLSKYIKKLQKPRTKLLVNGKRIESVTKVLEDCTIEDKLKVLELMLGSYKSYISVEDGYVRIEGIGKIPQDEDVPETITG